LPRADGGESVHTTPDLKLSEEAFPAGPAAVADDEPSVGDEPVASAVETGEPETADAPAEEPVAEAEPEAVEPGAEPEATAPGAEPDDEPA
jgi:hypothetical protein